MTELKNCPNCSANITGGWSPNELTNKNTINFLNFMLKTGVENYCNKCSKQPLKEAKNKLRAKIDQLQQYLKKIFILFQF